MRTFEVGEVIAGKYEVTRVLGRGGMGLVVAAFHRELDALVALKFLLPSLRESPQSKERFTREARTVMRLRNEHVARVLDVGDVDGTPFIVMEHLTGEDLAKALARRGPLPVDEAVDLLLQACEAVAEAHKLGIVHRDLKPANLFVTTGSDGLPFVKVLDFGISKSTAAGDPSVTASAAVVGSPLYMSPEQLTTSRSVDARADVWALGVVLYELLTGRTPFAGESFGALCQAVFGGTYARLSAARPGVPAGLDEAVDATLVRDPEARLGGVEEFAARIAPFGSEAAAASYQRIQRIVARKEAPSLLPAPRVTPAAAPSESTLVGGPPSAIAQAGGASVAVTGPGLTGSHESPEPRAPGTPWPARRRWIAGALVAGGAAVAAAVVGLGARHDAAHETAGAAPYCALDADVDDLCHQCRDQNCCAQYLACHGSAACGEYLDCTRACTTEACRLQCMREHQAGHAVAAPYVACAHASCAGPCGDKHAGPCLTCQEARCPTEALRCSSDPACDRLRACITACGAGNDRCTQACQSSASSATQALYNALFACGITYCASACG